MKRSKLTQAVATTLSFLVAALSAGLAPYEAAAQTFAAPESAAPALTSVPGLAGSLNLPEPASPGLMTGPAAALLLTDLESLPLKAPPALVHTPTTFRGGISKTALPVRPSSKLTPLPALRDAVASPFGATVLGVRRALAEVSRVSHASGSVAYQNGRDIESAMTGERFALPAGAINVPAAVSLGMVSGLRANEPAPAESVSIQIETRFYTQPLDINAVRRMFEGTGVKIDVKSGLINIPHEGIVVFRGTATPEARARAEQLIDGVTFLKSEPGAPSSTTQNQAKNPPTPSPKQAPASQDLTWGQFFRGLGTAAGGAVVAGFGAAGLALYYAPQAYYYGYQFIWTGQTTGPLTKTGFSFLLTLGVPLAVALSPVAGLGYGLFRGFQTSLTQGFLGGIKQVAEDVKLVNQNLGNSVQSVKEQIARNKSQPYNGTRQDITLVKLVNGLAGSIVALIPLPLPATVLIWINSPRVFFYGLRSLWRTPTMGLRFKLAATLLFPLGYILINAAALPAAALWALGAGFVRAMDKGPVESFFKAWEDVKTLNQQINSWVGRFKDGTERPGLNGPVPPSTGSGLKANGPHQTQSYGTLFVAALLTGIFAFGFLASLILMLAGGGTLAIVAEALSGAGIVLGMVMLLLSSGSKPPSRGSGLKANEPGQAAQRYILRYRHGQRLLSESEIAEVRQAIQATGARVIDVTATPMFLIEGEGNGKQLEALFASKPEWIFERETHYTHTLGSGLNANGPKHSESAPFPFPPMSILALGLVAPIALMIILPVGMAFAIGVLIVAGWMIAAIKKALDSGQKPTPKPTIVEVLRKHSVDLLKIPGVSMVRALGQNKTEDQQAIGVYFESQAALDAAREMGLLPSELDGYPVEYQVSGPFELHSGLNVNEPQGPSAQHYVMRYRGERPLTGGEIARMKQAVQAIGARVVDEIHNPTALVVEGDGEQLKTLLASNQGGRGWTLSPAPATPLPQPAPSTRPDKIEDALWAQLSQLKSGETVTAIITLNLSPDLPGEIFDRDYPKFSGPVKAYLAAEQASIDHELKFIGIITARINKAQAEHLASMPEVAGLAANGNVFAIDKTTGSGLKANGSAPINEEARLQQGAAAFKKIDAGLHKAEWAFAISSVILLLTGHNSLGIAAAAALPITSIIRYAFSRSSRSMAQKPAELPVDPLSKIDPFLWAQLKALPPGQTAWALMEINTPTPISIEGISPSNRNKLKELEREQLKLIFDYLGTAKIDYRTGTEFPSVISVQVNQEQAQALAERLFVKALRKPIQRSFK